MAPPVKQAITDLLRKMKLMKKKKDDPFQFTREHMTAPGEETRRRSLSSHDFSASCRFGSFRGGGSGSSSLFREESRNSFSGGNAERSMFGRGLSMKGSSSSQGNIIHAGSSSRHYSGGLEDNNPHFYCINCPGEMFHHKKDMQAHNDTEHPEMELRCTRCLSRYPIEKKEAYDNHMHPHLQDGAYPHCWITLALLEENFNKLPPQGAFRTFWCKKYKGGHEYADGKCGIAPGWKDWKPDGGK